MVKSMASEYTTGMREREFGAAGKRCFGVEDVFGRRRQRWRQSGDEKGCIWVSIGTFKGIG
jgi:hypothetical protein